MPPFINGTMKANATELQAEAKGELLQWVWGPFNFERLVVISLILQFILFFGAPFRKSTTNGVVLTLIWSTYLLADWVSYYSIGLALNGETCKHANHLYILWGSLLLAHISGPDTISALDMEDHQLWSRTALKFGTIGYSIARITSKAFGHKVTEPPIKLRRSTHISQAQARMLLYEPTVALFVVGIIKSLEKIATLILNRTVVFQEHYVRRIHADPTTASLVQGAVLVKGVKKPMISGGEELSHFVALRDAYHFFRVFRGCYFDFKFEFEDKGSSIREYFLKRSGEDAFRVTEMELNLMYDVFYTKANNFRKMGVRFVRYLTVIVEFVAFGCLASRQLNDVSNWFDAPITYALVLGALFMDTISTLGIVFSIRSIVPAEDDMVRKWLEKMMRHQPSIDDGLSFRGLVLDKLMSLGRRTWGEYSSSKECSYLQLVRRMLFRRWSESISQFNLIDYCLRRQPKRLQIVLQFLGVKERIHKATYVSYVWFTDALRDFIFAELKDKAMVHDHQLVPDSDSVLSELYVKWVDTRDFDECLLIWHIATDFCWTESDDDHGRVVQCRQWRKTLSDYMLCLLIQHSYMLKQPELGLMGMIRLESACESVYKKTELTQNYLSWLPGRNRLQRHEEARNGLIAQIKRNLGGNLEMDEVVCEGSLEMDAVVCEGYRLAERLKGMGDEKWELISKVWVDLLCRTAAKSKPSAHIRTLNKGGELLTIVWLLMNHLGIDNWGKALETPAP